MGWNGNAVNPYMTGMFNFPNAMGRFNVHFLLQFFLKHTANLIQECPWGWTRWQIKGRSVISE